MKLADDSFAQEAHLDPTRNLAGELACATPARKNNTKTSKPSIAEGNGSGGDEDEEMGSPTQYLRGTPEATEGPASKRDLRALIAQVEELKMADKGNKRAIDKIKQRQDKLSEDVKKIDKLEGVVQENSSALMEHADAIREAALSSTALGKKVDGAVQEMQRQGENASTQFETLKAHQGPT